MTHPTEPCKHLLEDGRNCRRQVYVDGYCSGHHPDNVARKQKVIEERQRRLDGLLADVREEFMVNSAIRKLKALGYTVEKA